MTVNLQIIARYPKHQRGTCRYPCFENCEVSFGKARFSNEFFGSEATSQWSGVASTTHVILAYLSSSPCFLRARMLSCLPIILQGHPTVGRYTTISTAGSCTVVRMHIFGPIQVVGSLHADTAPPLSCFPPYICRRVSVHSCNVCMLECHAKSVLEYDTSVSSRSMRWMCWSFRILLSRNNKQ